MEYLSHSPEETEHIGEELGRTLHAGSVVTYRGDWAWARLRSPAGWPEDWAAADV